MSSLCALRRFSVGLRIPRFGPALFALVNQLGFIGAERVGLEAGRGGEVSDRSVMKDVRDCVQADAELARAMLRR